MIIEEFEFTEYLNLFKDKLKSTYAQNISKIVHSLILIAIIWFVMISSRAMEWS